MLFTQGRRLVLFLLCILAIACSLFRTLRSEYIIFRNNNGIVAPLRAQDFTVRQGALLYETVSKYQWPSVLAFYEQGSESLKQELEQTVLSSKPFAEPRYMCEKICDESDSALWAVWIPNVLYELFVLHYTIALQDMSCLKKGVQFLHDKLGDQVGNQIQHDTGEYKVYLLDTTSVAEMKKQLLHDVFIHTRWWKRAMAIVTNADATNPWANIFLDINEFITTMLHSSPGGFTTAAQQLAGSFSYPLQEHLYTAIAAELIARIQDGIKNNTGFPGLTEAASCLAPLELETRENQLRLNPTSTIARAINLELKAQKTNKALLFRGTAPIQHPIKTDLAVLDSTLNIPGYKPRSISYGNGLFAGCFLDTWGTPYWYMSHSASAGYPSLLRHIGYGLMINKLVTAKNTDQNLFFVPPLSTLHGIFGLGQFFHPRTKAILPCGTCAEIDGVQHFWIHDALGVIATQARSVLDHEARYLNLLAKNAVVLSEPAQGMVVPENTLKANMRSTAAQLT